MCSRFALLLSVANEQIVTLIYWHAHSDLGQVSMKAVESCDHLATNSAKPGVKMRSSSNLSWQPGSCLEGEHLNCQYSRVCTALLCGKCWVNVSRFAINKGHRDRSLPGSKKTLFDRLIVNCSLVLFTIFIWLLMYECRFIHIYRPLDLLGVVSLRFSPRNKKTNKKRKSQYSNNRSESAEDRCL